MAEELDLHLLEFTRAEGEVAGRDFIAERFADLSDPKWDLHAPRVDDVLEVREDPLSGFRSEIGLARGVGHGADIGLEHQIELPRLGERAGLRRGGTEDEFAVLGAQFEIGNHRGLLQLLGLDRNLALAREFGDSGREFEFGVRGGATHERHRELGRSPFLR